ncbi:bifunctional indole-3-glycerol phosphate synthase/phosphoribosylanthranilate isomerase [Candidatus Roizmanbacteria bacterium]|nr:bifunctional indole-3-glycerol phosphate synthase/phosphoribosylanthranilate isomerase [Candidatus Roizmanbacteria bacterium]
MHNILLKIIEKKKQDLVLMKPNLNIKIFKQSKKKLKLQNNKFRNSIAGAKKIALIGEIKFASPTSSLLGSKAELLSRAKKYEESGVDAISIITEQHYFKADIEFVTQVKKHVDLPVLQKDFVIDAAQIYEAKQIGSDALLLIARLLDLETLKIFVSLCQDLGIEPVVEINSEEDLKKAIVTAAKIIAVNARDLETFVVDVTAACELLNKIPNQFIRLGFSGVVFEKEVLQYKKAGVRGVLVGTSLMKTKNIEEFILSLRATVRSVAIPNEIASSSFDKLRTPSNDEGVRIKICGVRDLKIAQKAISAGADFLGFNFVPTSKRYLDPKNAEKIISSIKGKIKTVGVFKNSPSDHVNEIAERLDLDFIQLHGNEDVEYRKKIKRKIIQMIDVDSHFRGNDKEECLLLDRKIQGKGNMVDLGEAEKFTGKHYIFFSGGLTPENVGDVVAKVRPFAVDVAGGIETNGVPDIKKIESFIKNAKGVNL